MTENGKDETAAVEPHYRLLHIQNQEALADVWPYVKKGLERIKHRDHSAGRWTHNHVLNSIKQGFPGSMPRTTTELHVALEDGKIPCGFVVLFQHIDPFISVPTALHVWCVYGNFRLIELFEQTLLERARFYGLDEIIWETGRTGWFRNFSRLSRLGYRVLQYKISKEVKY